MKNPLALITNYLKRTAYGPEDDYWYHPVHKKSITGLGIDEFNALEYSDVYKCVRVIAETIASLPLFVYKRLKDGGKDRAEDHPLYDILHTQPNSEMTAFQYREALTAHLLLWGNHYSQIDMNEMGDILGLWPLRPDRMQLVRGTTTLIEYLYRPQNGQPIRFPSDEILHIPGLGFNGISGFSPIALQRDAIGLGKAGQELAGRFYENDATPNGALQHPGKLGVQAHENLKKDVTEKYGGIKNKGKFMILEEGMTWQTITMPFKDIQLLDSRKFQREEICGIYRVPPHLIGDLSRATFSNIEQQSLDFIINCIRPWAVRIEQAMLVKLFSPKERKKYFPEHLFEGMLRGDIQTRYTAYAQARQWGWLSVDEIREKENMNPLPDGNGQTYLEPLNMQEIGKEPLPAKVPPAIKPQEQIVMPQPQEKKSEDLYLSFRRLFEVEVARIIRRESIAIRRALKKPDFEGFISHMDEFYRELPEFMTTSLFPVLKSYGELNGIKDVTDILKTFIDEHIAQSRGEIEKWVGVYIHEKDFSKNMEAIEEIFEGWQENRPDKASSGFYEYFNKKIEKKKEIPQKNGEILTFQINCIDAIAFQSLLANSTVALLATT